MSEDEERGKVDSIYTQIPRVSTTTIEDFLDPTPEYKRSTILKSNGSMPHHSRHRSPPSSLDHQNIADWNLRDGPHCGPPA